PPCPSLCPYTTLFRSNQYTLRVRDRDGLKAHLDSQGIGNAIYYPVALHLQPCFAALGYRAGDLVESERATREVLSLPVFAELTADRKSTRLNSSHVKI